MRSLIWIVLFLVATVLIGNGTRSLADDFVEIDAVINVTSQAGNPVATTQEVNDAVAKANDILKQAGIRIRTVRVNGPTSAAANAGNSDGNSDFDRAERDAAREAGGKELDGAVGAGKGIKITLGDNPQSSDAANPGISIHENRCAICRIRATSQLSGETIAHEIGHILTLTAGHQVTTTSVADDGGHSDDPNNFMNPSDTRTGTNVTTQQAEEMRKKAKTLGRTVTQPATSSPATSQPHGSGGKQDDRNDALNPVPPAGLNFNEAYHLGGAPQLELFFTLESALNPLMPVQWRYLWLWDIDANPLTGVTMFGVQGVERGVQIQLFAPGNGTFTGQVQFQTYPGGPNFPLPPATIINELEFDNTSTPMPGETSIRATAPYANFGFLVPNPTMYLVSIDPFINQAVDVITTVFFADFEVGKPQLALNPPIAGVGENVQFLATNFSPLSTAQLYLDSTLIGPPVFVGPSGMAAGSFVVPPAPQAVTGDFYFVTLIDGQGRGGFNIINLRPCMPGDVNHDGLISALDVAPFVQAILTAPLISEELRCSADINADGPVNGLDIEPFMFLLLND